MVDCSGINDVDATGSETLSEVLTELDDRGVVLHLSDVKGPVRDLLHRSGLWDRLDGRIHATAAMAVDAVERPGSIPDSLRALGVDERHDTTSTDTTTTETASDGVEATRA